MNIKIVIIKISNFKFLKEGHLRWDSLGEYLATAIGFQVGLSTAFSAFKQFLIFKFAVLNILISVVFDFIKYFRSLEREQKTLR